MRTFPVFHQRNAYLDRQAAYGPPQRAVLAIDRARAAEAEISSWPGYVPTPLVALPGLAHRLHVREIFYKDESARFGLQSFKALGGAYAALTLIKEHLLESGVLAPTSDDVLSGRYRQITQKVTLAAATDGNHGRSVAWAAGMFGCRCIIYLHEHVSQTREDEIARYGAAIRRVAGGYDHSVHVCAEDARANGWELVADTSANGSERAPILVMQGYTVLISEVLRTLQDRMPTHIFVPAAVGGLAAATVGHLWEALGAARPRIIAVQASRADCIARSIAAGKPVKVPGEVETFMACLAAAEVSPAAWTILHRGLDDVITIADDAARETMRLLAEGIDGDQPVVAGESGCAATAALIAAGHDSAVAAALALGPSSRILVIGSEGATDSEAYRVTVGCLPQDVVKVTP